MNITNQETGEVMTIELQSQEIAELAKALVKAQGLMTSAQKDGQNPHFKSSYATLDSIIQAIRKPLADNGLCVIQSLLPDNVLVTSLLHESGQWVRSYLRMNPVQNSPQGVGSALTYARRYSLAAIVGIAQADDDGEDAGQPAARPTPKKVETKPQPVPAAELVKDTNGGNGGAKQVDPFTRYWSEVKAANLSRDKGVEILAQAGNDPSRAVDVLLGMAQA